MSYDEFGRIGFFEDFQGLTDDDDITLSDATPVRWNDVLLIPISGDVAQNVLVTDGGGIVTFNGDGSAGDGICLTSAPMQPSGNGPLRMSARFKLTAVTDMRLFVGWQETVDRDETVAPFSLSGTTLTDNAVGQVFGLYYDTGADTDDWRAAGASDGSIFTDSSSPGIRANSTPVADEWMIAKVEIDPDGTARAWYGDSSLDNPSVSMNLIDTLPSGNLDVDAFYHPILFMVAVSTGDPTFKVDYITARGNRDWTV